MAKLHFANLAPSSKKTTLLSVLSDDHVFKRNDTMQEYIAYHGSSDGWKYNFSLIIITDKTKEELDYLIDEIFLTPSAESINKYTFIEPVYDSVEYWIMRNTGQISLTFAEFQQYVRLT